MSDTQEQESGRGHERLTTNVMAEVACADMGVCQYRVSDLSKTGAFLERQESTGDMPPAGTRVQLKLIWPIDTGAKPLEVEADVMRVADNGFGVQFII